MKGFVDTQYLREVKHKRIRGLKDYIWKLEKL